MKKKSGTNKWTCSQLDDGKSITKAIKRERVYAY